VSSTELTSEAHATSHPSLTGREDESRALADAVRRLIGLCVTSVAPADVTMSVAEDLNALADQLEPYVRETPFSKPFPTTRIAGETDMAARIPFDVIAGRHNPLALPLEVTFEPPKALLRGVFTRPHEGPPECVHGGVLAASFDLVLAAANFVAGLPGPTAELEITYRRPTALFEPCLFESWVVGREGRRVRTTGRLIQRGHVTVEARGEFVLFAPDDVRRMAARVRGDVGADRPGAR
jgi:acyl-coenzyme A thioesterase PaaI-like protein